MNTFIKCVHCAMKTLEIVVFICIGLGWFQWLSCCSIPCDHIWKLLLTHFWRSGVDVYVDVIPDLTDLDSCWKVRLLKARFALLIFVLFAILWRKFLYPTIYFLLCKCHSLWNFNVANSLGSILLMFVALVVSQYSFLCMTTETFSFYDFKSIQ